MTFRSHLGSLFVLLACLAVGIGLLLFALLPPTAASREDAAVSVVRVTAGKPTEFSFTVSPAKVASAMVSFTVTNRGKLPHAFKVCRSPSIGSLTTACAGTTTRPITPGGTTTLLVSFTKSGRYEYLSPSPTQAAHGMRGVLSVTMPATSTAPVTSPSTKQGGGGTTTTPGTGTTALSGDAASGQVVFSSEGCTDCHTIGAVAAAAGGNVSPSLNSTHSGGPFPKGPLTATQIAQIAAYVSAS